MKKSIITLTTIAIIISTVGGCSKMLPTKAPVVSTTTVTTDGGIGADTVTSPSTSKIEGPATPEDSESGSDDTATTTAPETSSKDTTTSKEDQTAAVTTETTTTPATTKVTTTTPKPTTTKVTATTTVTTQGNHNLGKIYYNTSGYQIYDNTVSIYPIEAWYEGGRFCVKCYITNGYGTNQVVTDIPSFIIYDKFGNEIVNAYFDYIGATVPSGGYITHLFTFEGDALINSNADYSVISWNIRTGSRNA